MSEVKDDDQCSMADQTGSMENIEHVVVLMLENRSFDSLLGWSYDKDQPKKNIPPAPANDKFRGLQNVDLETFTNTTSDGISSPPVRGSDGFTVPNIDPGEEFEHVNMQFFKSSDPQPGEKATMLGVLQDFVNVLKAKKYSAGAIKAEAPSIMQTYTQDQLPVLNQLARYYAVCDDWFASVPSQTNPNRAFLMSGTSHGLVNNGQLETNPEAKEIAKILGMDIGDDRFPEKTIFNALDDLDSDWAVFWQTSYLPQKISKLLSDIPYLAPLISLLSPLLGAALNAILLALKPYTKYLEELSSGKLGSNYTWRLFPAIHDIDRAQSHFKKLDDFHDLARAGSLPKFSYIEPDWTIAQTSVDAGLKNLFTHIGNDYHPPGNMVVAENFVRDVYASLIANEEAWQKSLLVITFDEFVGSFDHVSPPAAIPPWGDQPPAFPTNGFDFNRYGARVPTILVSPWVEQGAVFRSPANTPYDHTSVIATTLKWMNRCDKIEEFGERTKQAPMFDEVLTRKEPRTDGGAIPFMNVARSKGQAVQYGDPIHLRNKNGKYISFSERNMKVGTSLPATLMGYAVDLNLAAYFPTLDDHHAAQISFRTTEADHTAAVEAGATLLIVTSEKAVGGSDFLGAWADSHDCYYYNNYTQGSYVANQHWIVTKANSSTGNLVYGDEIYLESVHYSGQRLSHDSRPFQGKWITTTKGGDSWTIEPGIDT